MMTMMTPFGGMVVWDFNYDMMTQQNKVAATMIYPPLFMIRIFIITLLTSTNLGFIPPHQFRFAFRDESSQYLKITYHRIDLNKSEKLPWTLGLHITLKQLRAEGSRGALLTHTLLTLFQIYSEIILQLLFLLSQAKTSFWGLCWSYFQNLQQTSTQNSTFPQLLALIVKSKVIYIDEEGLEKYVENIPINHESEK